MIPDTSFLGRYRIEGVLGRGAMGVVYSAFDTRLGRQVAIKTVQRGFLADSSTASDYAERFVREAQAAARLSHPNIVTIFDFGEQDGVSYIVMEFIKGRELAQVFASGERLTLARSVALMGELLDALGAAHAQGIVHRDVKPANVMLDAAGHVKLADFGVARLVDGNQDRTLPGTLVGTPSYMSPEQILGQAVGSRTDLFAAGVVLYELLTGRRPFVGQGAFDTQKAILHDAPMAPSRLQAALPPAFDAVVARALAKQPEQRYASAAAFRDALLAAQQTAAAPAVPAVVTPPRRWLLAAGIGALAVAGVAGWALLRTPARSPAVPALASSAAAPAASGARASQDAVTPETAPAKAAAAAPAVAASTSPTKPANAAVFPVAAPVAAPTAAPRAARAATTQASDAVRTKTDPRCPELLMRMQLGDTLSPEQTTVFHTRCAR